VTVTVKATQARSGATLRRPLLRTWAAAPAAHPASAGSRKERFDASIRARETAQRTENGISENGRVVPRSRLG